MDFTHQIPLSLEFSRQEYWNGLPFSFPGDLPNSRIEPRSSAIQADSLLCELPGESMKHMGEIKSHVPGESEEYEKY